MPRMGTLDTDHVSNKRQHIYHGTSNHIYLLEPMSIIILVIKIFLLLMDRVSDLGHLLQTMSN